MLGKRKTDAEDSTKSTPYTVEATLLWSHVVPLEGSRTGNVTQSPDSASPTENGSMCGTGFSHLFSLV